MLDLILGIIIAALVLFIILEKFIFKKDVPDSQVDQIIREELRLARMENDNALKSNREELTNQLHLNQQAFMTQANETARNNEAKLENIRRTLQNSILQLNDENTKQLEKMRETVDEKLQNTLEKRLGQSFSLVNERLEQVYKGLGEMQTLAIGVGDLKKVLQNVKTRGIWGEAQLEQILEQVFAPSQYEKNVAVNPNSNERVEFAICLPGDDQTVRLAVDSKFPQEDYLRLIDASNNADMDGIKTATRQLELSLKKEAKDISTKYICPPYTTDFAIMFLPVEGLYAQVLTIPGLFEYMQKMRIVIAGPTTFVAIVNSLNVGFRTLAIEKRSSEVWQLLGVVKEEFTKFGDILDKTQKKIQEANNTILDASKKTRTIERKLRDVQIVSDDSVKLDDEEEV